MGQYRLQIDKRRSESPTGQLRRARKPSFTFQYRKSRDHTRVLSACALTAGTSGYGLMGCTQFTQFFAYVLTFAFDSGSISMLYPTNVGASRDNCIACPTFDAD